MARKSPRVITEDDKAHIYKLRKQGMSFAEIGTYVERDRETVRRMYNDYKAASFWRRNFG